MRVRRQGNNFGVMLLLGHMVNIGFENIPPVTLALVLGQTAIFLEMLPEIFPSALSVCMSTYLVLEHRAWQRMILGTFFHAHDMHLYFNMISLLSKGPGLERRFGSVYFAYLVAVFSCLTSATYVAIGYGLFNALQDQSYLTSCAVGFSGVLFALKVLSTEYTPEGTQYVFSVIPVPSRYICWVELVLIQLATPNASFVGHLAGILVGLAYTRGPLKLLMDAFVPPGSPSSSTDSSRGSSPFSSITNLFSRQSRVSNNQPRYPDEQPRSPYRRQRYDYSGQARPSAPTYDGNRQSQGYHSYTGGLNEDEQIRRATEESQRRNYPQQTSNGRTEELYPDLNDLRSRRANFYS